MNNLKIKGSPTGKRGITNITSKDNGHIVQTNGTYEYCVLCGSSTKATHANTNKQDGKTEFWRRRICKPNDRMIKYKENTMIWDLRLGGNVKTVRPWARTLIKGNDPDTSMKQKTKNKVQSPESVGS